MATVQTDLAKPALLGGDPIRREAYPAHDTQVGDRERELVNEVLDTGVLSGFAGKDDPRFHGGTFVQRFEQALCERVESRHAITFNSATSALHGAIAAAGVDVGDEVVTTPLTMTATASCILMQNSIPVFADVEDVTFNLDPTKVAAKVGPRTKAIMTVDLYGQPSDLDALRQIADDSRAVLIEDNSQALGTRYKDRWTGTVGQMGVLSFNYHKLIQTGEGGAVLTDDDELAFRLKLIRNHGEACVEGFDREDIPAQLGWNYRMDELAAAVGIAQLERLDFLTQWRVELGERLTERLQGHPFIAPPVVREGCTTNYYVYAMKFDSEKAGVSRDTFVEALKAEGIWVNPGYIPPLYRQVMYQKQFVYGKRGCPFSCEHTQVDPSELYREGVCPTAEKLHDEILITTSIIKYPHTDREIRELTEAIEKITQNLDWLREWEQENQAS